MDKINLKILRELDKNPRASFNQLGKAARVSKEVAQYRFKQMVKEKILTGFFAFIDPSKLGYQTNKILIKYKSVTREVQKNIVDYITERKIVAWAGLCEGTWDLVITTISPTSKNFVDFFNSFFDKFGRHFDKKEILIPIDNPIFNEKYLSAGELLYNKKLDFHSANQKIDEIDRKILLELSLNSRAKFTEIGEKLKLTHWAIALRYKKLVQKGIVVLLKPRIDFRKLGYSYYHVLVESNDEKTKKDIVLYYTSHKDCIMLMNHVGSYSLHLEFVVKKEEISDIILDLREKFGEKISRYEPLLIVEEYVMNLIR